MAGHPIYLALIGLGAYLIGAIPFSYIVPRVFARKDIREYGSGNPGASNVARECGKTYGAASLLLDAGKGVVAVFLVAQLQAPLAIGISAVLGHVTSPFLNFSGGKGVATYLGCIFYISWPAGLIFAGVWTGALLIWNYAGLSSLLAVLTVPVTFFFCQLSVTLVWASVGSVALIYFTHRGNIRRIVEGEENVM
ncbi:MAG: glycerol-3-phosphate 1-O-acyltransferase PlsY [Candidatus Acetothermia bacterium]|nr:glycerol-3-phosphate 1-O-acyltransferase PlsY [Candidatus Bipolaricaulota bacterium]